MNRREVIAAIAGAAATWPTFGRAQASRKTPRIGYLVTASLATSPFTVAAFRQGLSELGYVEGQSILVEYRDADSRVERFPALARELVRLPVDLIVASNSLAGRAAREATGTIPIVVPVMGDPVRDGLVESLARPGGNVTGLTFLGPELVPKRLALLKEALPAVSRIAALWHRGAYGEHTMAEMLKGAEEAARGLGVTLQLVPVQGPDDLDQAFSEMHRDQAEALLVFPSPMLFAEAARISGLAMRYRLAAVAMGREFAEFGALVAYGASLADLNRRAALYVDKILRGAKPADLPVEQPTAFELVVNLRTAATLGLDLPPSLLARADEVIE